LNDADMDGPSGAFALSVGAAALTAATMLLVALWVDGTGFVGPPLPLLFFFATIGSAPVIALAAAFIGLPLTRLLSRSGREAPWSYPAAGLIAGAAVLVVLDRVGMADSWRSPAETLQAASLGAVPGFVCGLSWWHLYRRQFQPQSAQ
jgi:hypothetical protein